MNFVKMSINLKKNKFKYQKKARGTTKREKKINQRKCVEKKRKRRKK